MPAKIEIKPNDQSWVGTEIRLAYWGKKVFITVKYVSKNILIGADKFNDEEIYDLVPKNLNHYWELYEEEPTFEPGDVLVSPEGEEWFVSFDGFIQPAKKLNLKPVEINKTYTKEQITKAFNRVLEEIKND